MLGFLKQLLRWVLPQAMLLLRAGGCVGRLTSRAPCSLPWAFRALLQPRHQGVSAPCLYHTPCKGTGSGNSLITWYGQCLHVGKLHLRQTTRVQLYISVARKPQREMEPWICKKSLQAGLFAKAYAG